MRLLFNPPASNLGFIVLKFQNLPNASFFFWNTLKVQLRLLSYMSYLSLNISFWMQGHMYICLS